jgi:prevent-host-death family protein
MTTVTFSDLRANLAQYFDMVEAGDSVTVTRNGKPAVQLIAAPNRSNPRTAELDAITAMIRRKMDEARQQPLVMRPGFTEADKRVAELREERQLR